MVGGVVGIVGAGKDGDKVCFEGADGALGGIATVHVRRHKLISTSPFIGDVTLVVHTGFVVKDDSVDCLLLCLESSHDGAGSLACLDAKGCTRMVLLE